jgi:hypothetical protein
MSRVTDVDAVDEFSWRAGYDQAVIDDTKKVQLALDIVAYLVKENERLRGLIDPAPVEAEDDALVECVECGSQFLWWQENAHQVSRCGVE